MVELTAQVTVLSKYGAYSIIDLNKDKVVHFKLVQVIATIKPVYIATYYHYYVIYVDQLYIMLFKQSNEVKGSYHMEKEGLHRCLNFLEHHDLVVDVLITDRHKQINKWLREEHPDVKHYYNVWHIAKGTFHIHFVQSLA